MRKLFLRCNTRADSQVPFKRVLGCCCPLLRLVPYERVAGVIQHISIPASDRHYRRQNRRIESARSQSRKKPTINRNRALAWEVAAEVDRRGTDSGLRTRLLVLVTGGPPKKTTQGIAAES